MYLAITLLLTGAIHTHIYNANNIYLLTFNLIDYYSIPENLTLKDQQLTVKLQTEKKKRTCPHLKIMILLRRAQKFILVTMQRINF